MKVLLKGGPLNDPGFAHVSVLADEFVDNPRELFEIGEEAVNSRASRVDSRLCCRLNFLKHHRDGSLSWNVCCWHLRSSCPGTR